MPYCGWVALLLVLAMLAAAPSAHAQKRMALVIGNSAYQHTGKLANPKNDASDVTAALRKHGFQVIEGLDLDKAAFDRRVRDFAAALKGMDAGVLFYAGHGLQVSGHNYLIPIDAKADDAAALDLEMVRVDVIHRIMERQTNTNILFLDACRDNPLARNLARSMGTRSAEIGRGLAAVESGIGTLISFSTQPGNVALDGSGRNSPFAAALVKQFANVNDDLSTMLIAVRTDVVKATQGKQVPWEHSALMGRFYFGSPPVPLVAPPTPPYSAAADAARICREVEGMSNSAMLAVLASQHKGTPAADCVAARIAEVKKRQLALATVPSSAQPAPSAPVKPDVQVTPVTQAPGTVFRDCPGCPEMVVVPAGSFIMGSPQNEESRESVEDPQHKVTIAKPFAVGKYETTFADWDACVAAGDCKHKPGDEGWGRGRRPVINVSWNDITQDYLPWLSRKTGKTYRLLTEAEWEYAARAGTTTPFSTGPTITSDQANFVGVFAYGRGARGVSRKKTVNTGFFRPNAFSLYEMHGNVWELVQDCFEDSYSPSHSDGAAVPDVAGCSRVARGGAWSTMPHFVRAAKRDHHPAGTRLNNLGFRVARTLDP